ncbi:hypothetical protein HKX48_001344 [Thoreauomyces humboldtii]|nr:hypothetical protein HKX48_001344 [Thoreauomyces humboldtii]
MIQLLASTASAQSPSRRILQVANQLRAKHTSLPATPSHPHLPIGALVDAAEVRKQLPPQVAKHLEGFSALINLPVQWGDQDSFGHLNNVQHMRYFESGRMAWFHHTLGANLTKQEYKNFMTPITVGPIVASVTTRYKAQATYPDTMTIGVRVDPASIKKNRFTQLGRIVSHAHGVIVAECECEIVTFDYENQKKADIPQHVLAALKQGEGIE